MRTNSQKAQRKVVNAWAAAKSTTPQRSPATKDPKSQEPLLWLQTEEQRLRGSTLGSTRLKKWWARANELPADSPPAMAFIPWPNKTGTSHFIASGIYIHLSCCSSLHLDMFGNVVKFCWFAHPIGQAAIRQRAWFSLAMPSIKASSCT